MKQKKNITKFQAQQTKWQKTKLRVECRNSVHEEKVKLISGLNRGIAEQMAYRGHVFFTYELGRAAPSTPAILLDDHQQNSIAHAQDRQTEAICVLQLGTVKSKQRECKPYGDGRAYGTKAGSRGGAIDPARRTARR